MQTTTKRKFHFFGKNLFTLVKYALAIFVAWVGIVGGIMALIWASERFGPGSVLGAVILLIILVSAWVDAGDKTKKEEERRIWKERGGP